MLGEAYYFITLYLLFFVIRYIVKQMKKTIKCENCLNYLSTEYGQVSHPAADFVNVKRRGYLTYPNHHVYLIIKSFELCFEKYADSPTVFEDTQNDLFQNNISFPVSFLTWNCNDHKSEILTDMFVIYITMRMRQYSYSKNIETKQLNKTKKNYKKLVTS